MLFQQQQQNGDIIFFYLYILPFTLILYVLWTINQWIMCMVKLCTFYKLNKKNSIYFSKINHINNFISIN